MTNEEKEKIEAVKDHLVRARRLTHAAHHVRSAGRILCDLKFGTAVKVSLRGGLRGVTDDLARQIFYSVDESLSLIEQALSGKGEPDADLSGETLKGDEP